MPDFAPAWLLLGVSAQDPAEVEAALWKGLSLQPCRERYYMALSEALSSRNQGDVVAKHLRTLAMWKIAFASTVPEYLAKGFQEVLGAHAYEPETYEALATAQENEFAKSPIPREVTEKLLPYRLLNELQRDAPDALEDATLERILTHAAECEPILRSALREWARAEEALDEDSLRLILAILGEISPPDAAEELLELANYGEKTTLLHANWALYRMLERFPLEVRETMRAAIKEAPTGLRCAIADQVHMAKPQPGDADLLASLVDGMEAGKSNHDAAYLLATVVHALIARGEKGRAKELAAMRSRLDAAGQELVESALRGPEGFIPMLEDEEVGVLSLEEVCLDRLLMDDEEVEDEEELDEEELEEEVDLAPPVRPGRNDPCWCGSGKKYKKCHLHADEEADRAEAEEAAEPEETMSVQSAVMLRVFQAVGEWLRPNDMRRAERMYCGDEGLDQDDPQQVDAYVQWLLHDFRDAKRHTPIENFLRTRAGKLSRSERELLESLRDARYGMYEVSRVEPGSGIELHDLFGGDRMFVHDISSSNTMHRWDCVLVRAQFHEGRWILAGNGSLVPRNLLDEVRSLVEKESRAARQNPAEFVRANSHRLHRVVREIWKSRMDNLRVVNREGEEVCFGKAEYAVNDAAGLLARLRSLEELQEDEAHQGQHFTWLPELAGELRPMGNLRVEGGRLFVEAMSRTRLQTLRGLVEQHAGGLLKLVGDHYTSADEIKQRAMRGEKPPQPEPPPVPAGALAAVEAALGQHYASWPDEPLPALGGKTAREAVGGAAGREAVTDLLRLLENGEERKRRSGQAAYDINLIRRELGLPEE